MLPYRATKTTTSFVLLQIIIMPTSAPFGVKVDVETELGIIKGVL